MTFPPLGNETDVAWILVTRFGSTLSHFCWGWLVALSGTLCGIYGASGSLVSSLPMNRSRNRRGKDYTNANIYDISSIVRPLAAIIFPCPIFCLAQQERLFFLVLLPRLAASLRVGLATSTALGNTIRYTLSASSLKTSSSHYLIAAINRPPFATFTMPCSFTH